MSTEIRKLTYQDYVCFPDDGKRHEIIGGDHYVHPAPSTYHQYVSRRMQFQLYTSIEMAALGVVITIVDPFEHHVLQLVPSGGQYREQSFSDRVSVHYLPDVEVDLTKVW